MNQDREKPKVDRAALGGLPVAAPSRAMASSPARSALMRRVRQKGTDAETQVGAALRAAGVAYRKNVRTLPGSPDFANRRRKWALFVNGCFWHRHKNCPKATVPKANREFWLGKFAANRARDARAIRALRKAGFKVMVVWTCQTDRAVPRLCKVLAESGRSARQSASG